MYSHPGEGRGGVQLRDWFERKRYDLYSIAEDTYFDAAIFRNRIEHKERLSAHIVSCADAKLQSIVRALQPVVQTASTFP